MDSLLLQEARTASEREKARKIDFEVFMMFVFYGLLLNFFACFCEPFVQAKLCPGGSAGNREKGESRFGREDSGVMELLTGDRGLSHIGVREIRHER
jgi:hypothetical protein